MSEDRARILIVDDEPDLLTVLKFGLEADGFDVIQASDGEQGLALARQHVPDLIVLDLMLPRMDGYKVCRALKFDERYRRIPIVPDDLARKLSFDGAIISNLSPAHAALRRSAWRRAEARPVIDLFEDGRYTSVTFAARASQGFPQTVAQSA